MSCAHARTRARKRKTVGGMVELREQCVGCGAGVGPGFQGTAQQMREAETWRPRRSGGESRKRREYGRFMRSQPWKLLRSRVLARDNYTCRVCGEPGDEVDHLTYERFGGDERLSDLRTVCADCHQRAEQRRRAGGKRG